MKMPVEIPSTLATAAKKQNCEHHAECMKMIQIVLDGQATPEQLQAVSQNIHRCSPCEETYKLETCIKEALTLRLEKKCVPTNLIDCIRQKISFGI